LLVEFTPLVLTFLRAAQEIIPVTDHINRTFLDLVRRLLEFDPNKRISVRDALQHPYFSLSIPEEI
jgi:dual-specificity kinase